VAEPIHRGGTWWHEQPDGTWLRFDEASGEWAAAPHAPPPASAEDRQRLQVPASTADATAVAPPLYRSPAGWARWAVTLLVLAIVLDGVAVISDSMEIALLDRIESGDLFSGAVTPADVERSDDRQATIGWLRFLLLVAASIPWLGWFRLSYRNLPYLGVTEHGFKPGWAIGSWFVPFLNFVKPKQMADDIWRTSDPMLPVQAEPLWRGKSVHALLHWWWAAWIVSFVLGWQVGGDQESASIDQLQTESNVRTAAHVVGIAAGILAIQVVRRMTARQEARVASLATMGATMAPSDS